MDFDSTWEQSVLHRTELLTPAQMGRADALAPSLGVSGPTLMDNAGRAVARAIRRRFRPCRTLVLCGPGNNGGDGYVIARHLQQEGWPVTVAALAAPKPGTDAAGAACGWNGPVVGFSPGEAARAGLVVDAVFGAGLSRDVDGVAAATLAAASRIVAVDVPSGLDGQSGAVRGFAPQALLTVTFFRLKPGHLLLPGRGLCGELVLADIGMPAVLERIAVDCRINLPSLWHVPSPAASGHKYDRGHVTILGGATMTGAARLAAEAARRAGAGMLTIAAQANADLYRAGAPGVIVDENALETLLHDPRRKTWVCGPGLGAEAARRALPVLLASGRQVLADADAFSAAAGNPAALQGAAVITPHEGEFVRVFGPIGADRVEAARAAARSTGAVVLLKGADTVIAAPDGQARINASAPPWLATAGAGDVLSGIIAGLMAQGMTPFDAASAGAWLHGRAATLAGPGMLAEDIAPMLAPSITQSVIPQSSITQSAIPQCHGFARDDGRPGRL
jgi:hydroxyethylthiazole kinase-like uncharacterized protein yjeF